ncbi:hypothetical protein T492DRAFT_838493 [Pavlovales sp. CCMP2436]|nr:hypothetical protein T492DRAFT_838493 [Pavlovales sp. CCMP2436]
MKQLQLLALGVLACASRAEEGSVRWDLSASSASPSPRSRVALGHQEQSNASGATEHYAWLFGGLKADGSTSTELWRYDVAADNWDLRLPSGSVPACHGCVFVSASTTSLHLLMGEDSTGAYVRTVYRLDISGAGLAWTLVANSGPVARSDHTSTVADGGDSIILFGGKNASGSPLSDVWQFNVNSSSWTQLFPSGVAPAARAAHTATAISDSLIAVFGGVDGAGSPLNDLYLLGGYDGRYCGLEWHSLLWFTF